MRQSEGVWMGIVAIIVLAALMLWWISYARPLNPFYEPQSSASGPDGLNGETAVSTPSVAPHSVIPRKTNGQRTIRSSDSDVVSIVQSLAGVSEFSSLLYASGIASTLRPGATNQYTIFVPLNSAFSKLPRGTITDLSAADRTRLVQYHIVSGRAIDVGALTSGSIMTLSGDALNVSANPGNAPMVGSANIIAQYNGTNGVVYVIDTVLLPPKKAF